jgi:hypothetical protein
MKNPLEALLVNLCERHDLLMSLICSLMCRWARALDGSEYMPGLVGLNNMRANDYVNVVIHILSRVSPIR